MRASGALGRSDQLIRLFDYLLECSLAERYPREIEIAQDVFSRGADFDVVQDASVRVYVYRLRKKLEEFYADTPPDQDRLAVPRGEYRLTLSNAPVPSEGESDLATLVPAATATRGRTRFWIVAGILVAINVVGWAAFLVGRPSPLAAAARSAFWKPLGDSFPPLIVVGDYYIFGEAHDGVQVTRLVREFSINSRDDLDTYLMEHPNDMGRYVDVDLHYLPVSVSTALRDVLPIVSANAARKDIAPRVVTTSELTPTMIKRANIVYVGFLSGLGMLREPLFEASGFRIGESYDELIDKASGKRFSSDWSVVTDGKTPRRDYAYLASMPGPGGNRILIVAGTRDAAVLQASEMAASAEELKTIAAKAGSPSFEALYEVRTMGNLNLGSGLVIARPLRTGNVWQPNQPTGQKFPDQLSPADGNGQSAAPAP